jgi:hypothetical protein
MLLVMNERHAVTPTPVAALVSEAAAFEESTAVRNACFGVSEVKWERRRFFLPWART